MYKFGGPPKFVGKSDFLKLKSNPDEEKHIVCTGIHNTPLSDGMYRRRGHHCLGQTATGAMMLQVGGEGRKWEQPLPHSPKSGRADRQAGWWLGREGRQRQVGKVDAQQHRM